MRCVNFKSLERGSLLGFADIAMDSGIVLLGCTMHASNGKRWVNPPSRPQLDADRKPMVGPDGKIIYAPIIDFAEKKLRYRWSDEAVAAIEAFLKHNARKCERRERSGHRGRPAWGSVPIIPSSRLSRSPSNMVGRSSRARRTRGRLPSTGSTTPAATRNKYRHGRLSIPVACGEFRQAR